MSWAGIGCIRWLTLLFLSLLFLLLLLLLWRLLLPASPGLSGLDTLNTLLLLLRIRLFLIQRLLTLWLLRRRWRLLLALTDRWFGAIGKILLLVIVGAAMLGMLLRAGVR